MTNNEDFEVSIKPSDALISGSLNDIDATIKECRYVLYTGKQGNQPAKTTLRVTYEDDNGTDHEVYYGVSKVEQFIPNEDGTKLQKVGTASGINNKVAYFHWANSFVEAGFPTTKFSGSLSTVFEGYKVHLLNKNAGNFKAQDGKDVDYNVLCVSQILSSPDDAVTTTKTTNKATAAKKTDGAAGDRVNDATKDLILTAIVEAGGTVSKAQVTKYIMATSQQLKKGDPTYPLKDIVQLAAKVDFLTSQTAWHFDEPTGMFALTE